MSALALLWLAVVPRVRAHTHSYPIRPVAAVLRVQPDRAVVDLESDSTYWIEEIVGLHPMPPRGWPPEALAKTEEYANRHLRLAIDGKRLPGRLIAASYIQRPWQVNEEGLFRLRLAYPSLGNGAELSGEADFFAEYRQERLLDREPITPSMDFRTSLTIPGRRTRRFELKPGAYSFNIPLADARSTVATRLIESLKTGAASVFTTVEGWAALAALALSLSPRSSLAFIALLTGLVWPASAPGGAAWAAGVLAALAAGRWTGETSAPWLEGAALMALGTAWSGAALFWLPSAVPGIAERGAAGLGAALAASLALIAGLLVVTLERRRAENDSQSGAATLFARRRRLAATALLLMSACGFWQSFKGAA